LSENNIQIYKIPDCDSDEEEEFKIMNKQMKDSMPFAVVGSNQTIEVRGKKVRGRLYPWGVVEIENSDHNDFVKLRTMLM
jgi:septin family protein